MPETTHEGNDPMGALTTHRGPLDTCPAPECQDRIIEQQEDAADPVCKFDEGCHRIAPCDPGCGTPLPNQALRDRLVAAIKASPFDELRTVDYAPNGPLLIKVKVDDLADTLMRRLPAVLPPAADRAAVLAELVAKAEEWDGHITVQELRRLADEAQQQPAPLTPCTCRQAVHALEHRGRTIPTCPWCTPAPNIRPNQPAGQTVNTVDTRLLGTKEA